MRAQLTRSVWAEYQRDPRGNGTSPKLARLTCASCLERRFGGVSNVTRRVTWNTTLINPPGQHGSTTPLHEAARNGHTEIVQALISAGADVHALDENGKTPLHEAVLGNGHSEIVQLLIACRIGRQPGEGSGYTPLHKAAEEGNVERVQELISLGAAMSTRETKLVIHAAARGGT